MGVNTLAEWTSAQAITHTKLNEVLSAMKEDFVGRDTNGIATAGKNLGNSVYPWGTIYVDAINLDGALVDLGDALVLSPYKVVSGAKRSTSNQPAFLDPAGPAGGRSLTILGSVTPLVLEIAGETVSVSTNVSVTSLTAAPSSNNTATLDETSPVSPNDGRTWGEAPYSKDFLTITSAGSEITNLIGKRAAFKIVNGGNTEYFIATVESATILRNCFRGFFTNSSLVPMNRIALTNGLTITLMKLGWLFMDVDGVTAAVTYNEPTYSQETPAGPASGDYWFDLANSVWKRYNGSSFEEVDRILIGMFFSDSTDTLGVRCVDYFANYSELNQVTIHMESITTHIMDNAPALINVAGNNLQMANRAKWVMPDIAGADDMYTHSEQANTIYYFYIKDTGETIISDISPYARGDLKGFYHPHNPWRCVGANFNNNSSNFENQAIGTFAHGGRTVGRLALEPIVFFLSAANASQDTTGTVDVTGFSFQMLVTGRPVYVGIQASGAGPSTFSVSRASIAGASAAIASDLVLYRGATEIARHRIALTITLSSGTLDTIASGVPINFWHIDNGAEQGVHTYKWVAEGGSGTSQLGIRNAKMVAFEMK